MKSPKKILIANRGVIAIRALRAAKELGYQVASVYSTIDKDQKHLKLSDEAICIGPAAAKDSYLNEAAINIEDGDPVEFGQELISIEKS